MVNSGYLYRVSGRPSYYPTRRWFEQSRLLLDHDPVGAAIRESGWDVCSHGWRWVKHYELSEQEEREHIRKAIESMKQTVGERPLGWYCRYGPSVNTRRLIVEEGGFLYDSDAYNDELPYWVRVGGKPHLVVPYSLTANDTKFGAGGLFTADNYFNFVKDGFDFPACGTIAH